MLHLTFYFELWKSGNSQGMYQIFTLEFLFNFVFSRPYLDLGILFDPKISLLRETRQVFGAALTFFELEMTHSEIAIGRMYHVYIHLFSASSTASGFGLAAAWLSATLYDGSL